MPKLSFGGPTYFNEIIKYVANIAEAHVNNGVQNNYFVLLILTDG